LRQSIPAVESLQYAHILQEHTEKTVSAASQRTTVRARAHAVDAEQRVDVVRKVLREKFGAVLGVAEEDVGLAKKLSELGVDSLMAIEVKVEIIFLLFLVYLVLFNYTTELAGQRVFCTSACVGPHERNY
jgi:hypothetical protein